ncbi:NADH-quinone oxidoreductase subunit L [Geomonas sp. RF6]|uniref:NADH-quinone oxidoreductase subunit 5 family protein n=1 Tax=Geomonas sp. RF6 TaxID=2897342 RepID=UPI001E4B533F|nr:proton-conducting transporter membrane subunit [Geomonas sp. RF6]UFS70417.1 NADH-quinone oxidoreductase subunit L [Geomonas sp. RF6]
MSSLLFYNHGAFSYTPDSILGLKVNLLVTAADFGLLFLIFGIGWSRRNPLIMLLTVLQILPLAYFEFKMVHHVEVMPAFYGDDLSIIMNLIISIVGSLICIFGIPYMEEHEHHLHLKRTRQPRFFFFLMVFLGAMNGLVFANNLLWVYFFWEVTTLCSFMLISHDGTDIAIKNGSRALWMNMLGGVAFVAAIIFLYKNTGTTASLSLQYLVQHHDPSLGVLLPLALLCFAGFTKAAQVPFQSWLCGAMVAPTPVSALLHSSTMVKAGVYLIVRLAPAYAGTTLSLMVATFGAFTFLATSMLAVNMRNGKKILAYSTIANLGLIVACAGINTPAAIVAAILLIIFHAVSKGLLFLCVGTIEHNIGSRDIEDMRGLYNRFPAVARITILGMLTMMIPPFGALMSKWMAIEAAASIPWVVAMLALGSGLTMLFWARWAGILVSGAYLEATDQGREVSMLKAFTDTLTHGFGSRKAPWKESIAIKIPLLTLAAGAIGLSLVAPWAYSHLIDPRLAVATATLPFSAAVGGAGAGAPSDAGSFYVLPIMIVSFLGYSFAVLAARRKGHRVISAPYMCGEQHPDLGQPRFRGPFNVWKDYTAANIYASEFIGEEKISTWINIAAVVILILLFAGVAR